MEMLGALLGQLKTYFGKVYLATGLLPALVVFLAWAWRRSGRDGVQGALDGLIAKTPTGAAVLFVGLVLGLGFVLYAARGAIFLWFAGVPSFFGPVREYMRRDQRRQRDRVAEQLALAEFGLNALIWLRTAAGTPTNAPPARYGLPGPGEAARLSGVAFDALAAAAADSDGGGGPVSVRGVVVCAACALYARSHADGKLDAVASLLARWRAACAPAHACGLLDGVNTELFEEMVEAKRDLSKFPEKAAWIMPTILGNRLAALDDYAEKRYGIDTTTLWLRLLRLIPDPDKQEISGATLGVQAALNLSVSCAAVAGLIAADAVIRGAALWREQVATVVDWRAIVFVAGGVRGGGIGGVGHGGPGQGEHRHVPPETHHGVRVPAADERRRGAGCTQQAEHVLQAREQAPGRSGSEGVMRRTQS